MVAIATPKPTITASPEHARRLAVLRRARALLERIDRLVLRQAEPPLPADWAEARHRGTPDVRERQAYLNAEDVICELRGALQVFEERVVATAQGEGAATAYAEARDDEVFVDGRFVQEE